MWVTREKLCSDPMMVARYRDFGRPPASLGRLCSVVTTANVHKIKIFT